MKLNKKILLMMVSGVLAIASAFPVTANPNAAAGASQPAAATETTAAAQTTEAAQTPAVETWNPAASAMNVICAPSGIMMMDDGTMVITDTYNKVVWRTKDRVSTIIAGKLSVTDAYGEPVGGYNDGKVTESYFKKPWAVTAFLNGIAISDSANNVIRFIGHDGTETAVGNGSAGFVNGYGMNTQFNNPTGLTTDKDGNLYVADTNNNAIRKVSKSGVVTTYMSNVNEPTGLFWSGDYLYIAESGAHRILKVKDQKIVARYGTGTEGDVVGAIDQAQFSFPQGVAVSSDGCIYVSDTGNGAIKKIQDGIVTTLLMCDNTKMDLYPVSPVGIAVKDDKLYVCDNFAKKVLILNR